jgi:hypothetical protein
MSHVFRDIANYSKKRKISLINAIEKINWDTGYNPEEFLQLLTTKEKNWALSKMIAYMPYTTIRRILTKTFLKENINEEIISYIYPPSRQKSVRLLYSKL